MEKCLKSRKHTYRNLHNFVQSLTDKPVGDNLLVLPIKAAIFGFRVKPRVCQNPGSSSGVDLCPTVARGGWVQLELTDV